MLSELILASVRAKDKEKRPYTGLSCSGLFPCAYRMYKVHKGERWGEEPTEVQELNMADGWDQEIQAVRRLAEAGIEVKGRGKGERYLTVGKSNIPGSWDGYVELDEPYAWDHKAMNNDSFWLFKNRGMAGFPNYKAQLNAYTLGAGFKKYIMQAKCKETNEPYDIVGSLDRDFIMPIIEWADKIRSESWVPKPIFNKYCAYCGIDCFGTVLDMSSIGEASAPEMVERWVRAQQLIKVGEMLETEVKEFFIGKKDKFGDYITQGIIGDKEVLLVDGLKITKIVSTRFDVKRELVLKEFGPEGLMKVSVESHPVQYRFRDVGGLLNNASKADLPEVPEGA